MPVAVGAIKSKYAAILQEIHVFEVTFHLIDQWKLEWDQGVVLRCDHRQRGRNEELVSEDDEVARFW